MTSSAPSWSAADASVIRGLGVRRFAPSVPDMGAVTIERPGVLVENVAITDTATTGLHVGSGTTGDVTLRSIYLARNGMLGMNASNADRLTIDRMVSEDNNTEHFNTSPVSGGAKIGRTRGVVVRDSVFRGNEGPGLWMDESVYDMTITGNEMRDNAEARDLARALGQGGVRQQHRHEQRGLRRQDQQHERRLGLEQHVHRQRPQHQLRAGHAAADEPGQRGSRQAPAVPGPDDDVAHGPGTVMNNIIANQRTGSCMLCVEDYSTAAQRGADRRHRELEHLQPGERRPGRARSRGHARRRHRRPTTTSLTLPAATGQEAAGQTTTDRRSSAAAGNLVAAVANTAQPLPAAIAAVTGQTVGPLFHGAWPRAFRRSLEDDRRPRLGDVLQRSWRCA